MLVTPGVHRIRIALPGYESFQAEINHQPDQKVEIKTDLLKSSVPFADPLLKQEESATASSPAADAAGVPNAMASPKAK